MKKVVVNIKIGEYQKLVKIAKIISKYCGRCSVGDILSAASPSAVDVAAFINWEYDLTHEQRAAFNSDLARVGIVL